MTNEGLVLKHRRTGQRVFVVHGHQADLRSDSLYFLSRFTVRHIWRHIQRLGFGYLEKFFTTDSVKKVERQIIEWVHTNQQITICGHTHHPMHADYSDPPYFNCGSCIFSNTLTGLEIQNGDIMPIQWSLNPLSKEIKREVTGTPRKLNVFS